MHFVMHAFNNHVKVLHDVTPFVQLKQTAVLSDGVVVKGQNKLNQRFYFSIALHFNFGLTLGLTP